MDPERSVSVVDGDSPLHIAVRSGQVEDVRNVLDQELVSVNCLNSKHETPLHLSCSLGHKDIVVLLIAFGADAFIKDSADNNAYDRCNGEMAFLISKLLHHNDLWINGPDVTTGDTHLHAAVRQGDLDLVAGLTRKQHVSINDMNSSYETPLHLACALGHKSIVHFLVSSGADIYKKDCYNNAPIHRAVGKGHVEIINLLIATFGCNSKIAGYQGRTLLHFASAVGNVALVATIVRDCGANLCVSDATNQTPLHIAASHGQGEVVSLLVTNYNCPVDSRSTGNRTPLHLACYCSHTDVMRLLVNECNAEINVLDWQNSKPLHLAALGAQAVVLVRVLIDEFQCNPQEKGFEGRSLLHYVCDRGHTQLTVVLITEFNLDPCLPDDNGNTPLHIASLGGHKELARLLITKYNCPVDIKNEQSDTPLNTTVLAGHNDVAQMLISEYSCNPQTKGFEGRSLLHHACDKGHTKLAVLLITEFNLDPRSADDKGNTPLMMACLSGHEGLARLLITKYNCPVDVKNKQDETLLHIACMRGHVNIIKMLIGEYLADLNARDRQLSTPLHLAALGGHKHIVEALINEFQCNPYERGYNGRSLLHYACEKGHTKLAVMLIKEFKINPCLGDDDSDTPVHIACLCGHKELARLLITKYNCPVDIKNERNMTPLHMACARNHVNVAKMLIRNRAALHAHNYQNSTPMFLAALGGQKDIVETLINEFRCSPHKKGYNGMSLVHYACVKGHTSVADVLVTKFHVDPCLRDDNGDTPLHITCRYGHVELARLLITQFNCRADIKNVQSETPFELACTNGHAVIVKMLAMNCLRDLIKSNPLKTAISSGNTKAVHVLTTVCGCKSKPFLHQVVYGGGSASMLRELICNFGHDPACVDDVGNTLLHTAALCGKDKIIQMLAREYSSCCPIDSRNSQGQTPLHCACIGGHVGVVKSLLLRSANVYIRDKDGDTPIKKAHQLNYNDVKFAIFKEFGFHSTTVDSQLLHKVCDGGTIEFMDCLISDFKLYPSTLISKEGNSLLHTAASGGCLDMARHLLEKYNLDIECRNSSGQTPLHLICSKAPTDSLNSLLDLFLRKYKADISVKDKAGDQPIHAAIKVDRAIVVTKLILNYGCDAKATGHKHRSLLHQALAKGFTSTGKTLVDNFNLSVHCTDDNGNTPLHLSSLCGQACSVKVLLYDYHASVFVRNKAGKTAHEVAKDQTTKRIFEEYIRSEHRNVQAEYEQLRSLSLQEYPGEQRITRIFVLGNVESGKSTLIESLKRKGFISSLFSVSSADVPPHTAGIIPSLYENKEGGRFLYYDFAGDKEYYSSHSAILEIVTQSSVGTSVYVIVANLTKELSVLFKEIGYWLSFISYHAKVVDSACKLKAVIVLSHSDRLGSAESSRKSMSIKQYIQANDNNFNNEILDVIEVIASNCRKPRSSKTIEDTLQRISRDIHPSKLSFESTLLHGMLGKDFRNVVACKFQDLVNHVKDTGIYLPSTTVALHPIVKELHDIGVLMMIGKSEDALENYLLLLNPCTLTNEVHHNLFSMTARQNFISTVGSRYAKMGIIPESRLIDLLPEHITKDCLIQLQYCQEFSHAEVGLDYTLAPDVNNASKTKDNLLYFPALCNLESKGASLSIDSALTLNIGWYTKCVKAFDYFPVRFLHVVILRLAFSLALPIASCSVTDSTVAQAYSRRCTMWKNGIHWLMEEGVECTFELVDNNKGVVVVMKAKESCKVWATILGKIIDITLQAKSEFCDTVTMHQFLLNSADPLSFKDEDKLFDINDVRRVLREGKDNVLSVGGNKLLDSSYLSGLKGDTYWGM